MANIVITANFNVKQVSASLGWDITREDESNGKCETMNGLYRMEYDDIVQVRVTALSVTENVAVQIVECHLISRPILFNDISEVGKPGSFPYPSPFFKVPTEANHTATVGAVTPVEHFKKSSYPPLLLGSAQYSSAGLKVQCAGRWDMSMFMTVAITSGAEDARVTSYNVYCFDPEGDVTTGHIPPK